LIIKSHIRGGIRAAATYLKAQGANEKTRLVEISDPEAATIDAAFQNMWAVASKSHAKKPLHNIRINPYRDERLTDEQVLKIAERCEQVYGYKPDEHQRVIVEHIKDGRQHFHVMWNRISLDTGKAVWPGMHWNKSKQVAREMEAELGLRSPQAKKAKAVKAGVSRKSSATFSNGTPNSSAPRTASVAKPHKAGNSSAAAQTSGSADHYMPAKPNTKGWPEAAVLDWEVWGHKAVGKFFTKWRELATDGFVLGGLGL
jgi:hypothetical protein